MTDQTKTERSKLAKHQQGELMRYDESDVARYAAELGELATEMGFQVAVPPNVFGLGLEVYDPVSHDLITVVRRGRRDIAGISQIILNLDQVKAAVTNARVARAAEKRHMQ
jgi:hypothetical protein